VVVADVADEANHETAGAVEALGARPLAVDL
jgi:hypothetical protein